MNADRLERAAIVAENEPEPLASALWYASGFDWKMLPGVPGQRRPSIKSGTGHSNASLDPGQLRSWWRQFPEAEPLIATGPSRLVILDVDKKNGKDGEQALRDRGIFDASNPPPWTATATSPSGGGWHWYFNNTTGLLISSGTNVLGCVGVDVRAEGGLVVAPSPGNGRRWRLGLGPEKLLPLPGRIATMLLAERSIRRRDDRAPAPAGVCTSTDLDLVLSHLDGVVWHGSYAMAVCPGHSDHDPSLAVELVNGRVLLCCHGACDSKRDPKGAFRRIAAGLEARGLPKGVLGKRAAA